jgi:hypothetical protein
MNMKKNTSQTGDDAEYTPNWISMGDFPSGESHSPLGNDSLFPDDDASELDIALDEDLDYQDKEPIRY